MQLDILIRVQEYDLSINRIQKELAGIPKMIEVQKAKFNQASADVKHYEQKSHGNLKERHALELEVKTKEEEILRLTGQMYALKTNEQYKAMQDHIAGVKKEISGIEDKILNIFEFAESSKTELERLQGIMHREESRFKDAESLLLAEKQRLESLLQEQEALRKKEYETISPDQRRVYDRIHSRYPDSTLSLIKDNCCQACAMSLPAQLIQQALKGDTVVLCENCSRILYYKEND